MPSNWGMLLESVEPMDLKQLRDFVAVYEERGFTKAAERQNATQPGMSTSIAMLEQELSLPLFERHARGVSPTVEGTRFYNHAVNILSQFNAAREDMRWMAGQISGKVTVGLPTTMFKGRFARLLLDYTQRFPAVELHIIEANSSPLLASLLEARTVDFALISQRISSPTIEVEPFISSPLVFISGPGKKPFPKQLKLSELPPVKLVLPSPGSTFRAMIDDLIALWKVDVQQQICVDGLAGMLDFMTLSDWCTFLPAVAVFREMKGGEFNISRIVEPEVSVDHMLARSLSVPLSRAASEFLEQLRTELRSMCDEAAAWINAERSD